MKLGYKHIAGAGLLLVGVVLAGFFLASSKPGQAAATQFSLSPSTQTVTAGSTFTVTVELTTGGNNVAAAQVGLSYPTNLLTCEGTGTASGFTVAPQADSCGGGSVLIQRGRADSFSSDASVATVTFKALTAGTSPTVSFTGSTLAYYGANTVASSTTSGTYPVSVLATPPSSPSPAVATSPSSSSSSATSSGSGSSGHGTTSGSTGSSKSSGTASTPSSGTSTSTGSSTSSSSASGSATAPTISNLQIVNITATSATVSWSTDQPATSEVGYSLDGSYQLSAASSGLTTDHSVALNPTYLERGLIYHVRVTSTNAAGAAATGTTSFLAGGFNVSLHVVDKAGHILKDATVELDGQSGKTNSEGDVTFTNVPYGTQAVTVSYQGASTKSSVTVGKPGAGGKTSANQSFTLAAATSSIQPIAIATIIIVLILIVGWEVWQWRAQVNSLWRKPQVAASADGGGVTAAGGGPSHPAETAPTLSTPVAPPPDSSSAPLPGTRFEPSEDAGTNNDPDQPEK
jgi:hypothetical protein